MYIIGTKLFHHDSAIFILDFQNKEIFALSTERITRVKHDPSFITPILIGMNKNIFKKTEYIVYPFLSERDFLLKLFFYRYGINAKIEKKNIIYVMQLQLIIFLLFMESLLLFLH